MDSKIKLLCSSFALVCLSACSAYSTEDYGAADSRAEKTTCINMEPAQEMKCREKEESLLIGLGADKNCNHPYEYERNRCKHEQAKKQKALDESLKKHTDK